MSEAGTHQLESAATAPGRSFAQRFVGALRLDGSVYEEVASDPGALAQAAGVAVIAAVARAVVALTVTTSGQALFDALFVLCMWPLFTLLAWGAGRALRHSADLGRVARAAGFAMAPLILVVLGVVPVQVLRVGVSLISLALLFGAMVVSMRAAFRTDTGNSAFICLIVGLAFVFVYLGVILLTAQPGAGS